MYAIKVKGEICMKRLAIILVLLFGVSVSAQKIDTIFFGMNELDTSYFYDCWAEDYYPGPEFRVHINDYSMPMQRARSFVTKDSLRIIGVASCALELKSFLPEVPDDTLAEYFQIYEATDTSFVKIAETRWDTAIPTKYMELIYTSEYRDNVYIPIYEAYFDSAVTVYDSFYVAYTSYNNGQWLQPGWNGQMQYMGKPTSILEYVVKISRSSLGGNNSICNKRWKYKFLPVEGDFYSNRNFNGVRIDTTVWYSGLSHTYDYLSFAPIFPIFEYEIHDVDTCADVSNFAVVGTDSVSALFSWDSTARSIGWELAYGLQGTAPEDATVLEMSSTVHRLSGLDSGAWYVAYVRAKCGEEEYSNWSSGVEFYIAGDTTSRELSIHTSLLEQYTYLMPNPAHDVVSVFSSFSMNRLEVYSMNGVLMERMDCEGLSTQLTVSGYPRGAYIVKVYTPKGVATKKLVVK